MKKETAVEEFFTDQSNMALGVKPLTDEESKILIALYMSSDKSRSKSLVDDIQIASIIKQRAEKFLGYEIDDDSCVFLAVVSPSPAIAVMYVHHMATWLKQHNDDKMTLAKLCEHLFPFGFVAEEAMKVVWDKQKVWKRNEEIFALFSEEKGTDNMLDRPSANTSLREYFLKRHVDGALTTHADKILEYHKGNAGMLGLFMGEVMKTTKGNADPHVANRMILEALSKTNHG